MSVPALSRRLIIPVLFFGLAAMLIGFVSYRVNNPVLIKHVAIRAPEPPEQIASIGSGVDDCPDCGVDHDSGSRSELMPKITELMVKLQESPEDFDIRMELAEAFMQAHDPAGAAQHLQKAVELRPENYLAHYYLGIMFYALHRYEEAVQRFEHALTLEEDPHIMFNLALLYLRHTDREAEALAILERTAASDDPDLQERSKLVLEHVAKASSK